MSPRSAQAQAVEEYELLVWDSFSFWVMVGTFSPFVLAFLWHICLLAALHLPWLRLAQEGGDCGDMALGAADVAVAF